MTRESLWKQYCKKNPDFNKTYAVIKITGNGLRKLFDTTFDQGHALGFKNGQVAKKGDDPMAQLKDIFKGVNL